jgi:hypothetical protein
VARGRPRLGTVATVKIRAAGVAAGWAVGILAFALAVDWIEREAGLSLGPSLAVGASVALIWVTRTYVLATKKMADDQAALLELQRRAPYRAALADLWILATRSLRLTAEVRSAFEYAVTGTRGFDDAFAKLDETRQHANDLSLLATDFLGAAGTLDPTTAHGNMAADHSIAVLKYTSSVMPAIAEAVAALTARRTSGLSHHLPAVPKSFVDADELVAKSTNEFLSAINDELGGS